ncbi:MAG: hypothetical protein ACFFED_16160 [Candidatus Thorarchaeota archaeon]
MEPIGTITAYFSLVEDDTQVILESTMEEAQNFREFVDILCASVLDEKPSDELIFFAVHFAALLFDFNLINRIADKYSSLSIIRPNLFYGSAFQGKHEDFRKVREAADNVMATGPPDWLKLEMYIVKLEAENEEYPKELYDSSTHDAIENMIKRKPEFGFYKSRVLDSLSIRAIRDGDTDQALELNQRAIQNAEEHNDFNRLAHLLRTRASILQSSNREVSHELLRRSHVLLKSMGDKGGMGDVLFLLSKLESIQGNYDRAIEYNLECIVIWQSIGMPTGMFGLTLSTLYNLIGDQNTALEWAKMAESELLSKPMLQPRAVLNQAWALAESGKILKARQLVDSIRDSILKSGLESNLGWLYLIDSIIEPLEGNYYSAANHVEESLDIYERARGYFSYYICLHQRAKIEVSSIDLETTLTKTEQPGTWLLLLEEKARKENLQGLLAQALILQVEFFNKVGNEFKAESVLEELKDLMKEGEFSFLESRVKELER